MPQLRVRCNACGQWIPTGMEMDYASFRELTYTERSIECPSCEAIQVWNLDDVDRSVFQPGPK